MHLRHLVFGLHLAASAFCAAASTCAQPDAPGPLSTVIADAARREHREFGGHVIHHDGTLWKFGSVESESELLQDPETGIKSANRVDRFTWRRVWSYWLALERRAGDDAVARKVIYVPGLLENAESTSSPREVTLRTLQAETQGNDPELRAALSQSAVRAAMNDAAWSAAFIAFVMDAAQLRSDQFRYSPAHSFYIKRAFEQPKDYVYRACDPRTTIPRPGDLLCYSRGSTVLTDFTAWKSAAGNSNFAVASHCDVVIEVDLAANKMDTVGGNVLQSVTRRSLKLNAEHYLSRSYHPARHSAQAKRPCPSGKQCVRENFNQQYWGVLLQLTGV